MKTLLIVNPTSGHGRAARAMRRLLDLTAGIPLFDSAATEGPEHAVELARRAAEDGYEFVVAAGGDGTVNQVLNGIGDSGVALGVVPLGTANVLARDIGLPLNDLEAVLTIIQAGRTRAVDMAQANGVRFVLMAGIGFDAAVVDSVSPKIKDALGMAAYAPAIFEQVLTFSPSRLRLEFDGGVVHETEAYAVIAANCGSYASSLRIVPEAAFDDGLLDILVFECTPGARLGFVEQAVRAVLQQHASAEGVCYFRSARVRIESTPPLKYQLDGDVRGEGLVDIRTLPKALRLVVP